MAQVDPCYPPPSPAFFLDKALPLLCEARGEWVCQEMEWAEGSCIDLTLPMAAQDMVVEDYVAVAGHWGMIRPGSWQVLGSLRKQAVLWL